MKSAFESQGEIGMFFPHSEFLFTNAIKLSCLCTQIGINKDILSKEFCFTNIPPYDLFLKRKHTPLSSPPKKS